MRSRETGSSNKGRRLQMRNQGYTDGYAGRAARHLDAEYQASYRRGREARDRDVQAEAVA